MNLFKRHIGRRVAGVGVGVALLMLGLQAPAFAAPTIASFDPTSGPTGCLAVVTGTGFTEFPDAQTHVFWVDSAGAPTAEVTDRAIISDTEIWAVVTPVATGPHAFRITTPGGTVTSTVTFEVTTGAAGCAPTITSFTPTCGSAGTVVTITGTHLLKSSDPSTTATQTVVKFSPYPAAPATGATHSVPNAETPTTLSVIVPSGTTDGKIQVMTFATAGGTIFSTEAFQVPPPDCPKPGGNVHARSITLSLRKHLVARGKVSSTEDPAFTDCVASVPVKIQRRRAGGWRTVGSTTTTDTGAYKKRIKDRPGKYRALAPKVSLGDPVTDTCSRAVSPRRTHRH